MSLYSDLDLPHRPTEDLDWQESWVLIFRDPLSDAVGWLRTGYYPNREITSTHWAMALPDGTRFRRNLFNRKMEPGDVTDTSCSSGNMKFSIPNMEYVRFEANDPDAEADLRIYDWFPSQDWAFVGGPHHGIDISKVNDPKTSRVGSSGHPESAGRLEGRIRFGDRIIDIQNGFAYREHGLGPRRLDLANRSGRCHFGTVGPNLSYSLLSMTTHAGEYFKLGYVMLNGKRETIRDLHTVANIMGDGCSVLGGWTVVQLESGQTLRIEVDIVDGVVTSMITDNGGPGSSPAGIEAMGIPRWNGQAGVCDFNIVDNAHLGEAAVKPLFLANCDTGLSRRTFDSSWIR